MGLAIKAAIAVLPTEILEKLVVVGDILVHLKQIREFSVTLKSL